jgi:hypothetical protein
MAVCWRKSLHDQHQHGGHGMKHLVKFWDSPLSPRPVAIDFLTADSFADAMEKAAAHAEVLRSEFDGRLGYSIEDEAGRTLLVRPGERLA